MDVQTNLSSLSVVACSSNSTASYQIGDLYKTVMDQLNSMDFLNSVIPSVDYNPMLWSLFASMIVGLSGVFPLLIIPIEEGENLNKGASGRTLKVMLSFAVGGLLGDVFLHLLPEAWNQQFNSSESSSMFCGMWVLTGLLVFIIAEKAFAVPNNEDEEEELEEEKEETKAKQKQLSSSEKEKTMLLNNNMDDFATASAALEKKNGYRGRGEGEEEYKERRQSESSTVSEKRITSKQMSGYLNLVANSIDNFAHGLAVGGSFVLGARVGLFSTLAIVVHEVPHEVGDFAILLRAGFTRWQATKAQMATASAGLLGAYTAVSCSGVTQSIEARTSWILPFTAGGFLHIALVTTLPELLQEENPRESLKQMVSLIGGILIMAMLTALIE